MKNPKTQSVLNRIYSAPTLTGRTGKTIQVNGSSIDAAEGDFLHGLIKSTSSIRRTLEIGLASGASALNICDALDGRTARTASHTAIDPFQISRWDSLGMQHLEECGFEALLIEDFSEFALPKLLSELGEGSFDLVFVDGKHTFDHAMLDCFYANRLLPIDGWLVLDDARWLAIRRVVDQLCCYPCYEPLNWNRPHRLFRRLLPPVLFRRIFERNRPSVAALKKVAKDERSWDWFCGDF